MHGSGCCGCDTSPCTIVRTFTACGLPAVGRTVTATLLGVTVASGTTNSSGTVSLTVPGPGTYTIAIAASDGFAAYSATVTFASCPNTSTVTAALTASTGKVCCNPGGLQPPYAVPSGNLSLSDGGNAVTMFRTGCSWTGSRVVANVPYCLITGAQTYGDAGISYFLEYRMVSGTPRWVLTIAWQYCPRDAGGICATATDPGGNPYSALGFTASLPGGSCNFAFGVEYNISDADMNPTINIALSPSIVMPGGLTPPPIGSITVTP